MASRERQIPIRRARDAAPSRRLLLVVLFGIAQLIFITSGVFRVSSIEVVGNARLHDDVIKGEARLPLQAHLGLLDLEGAAERVRSLRWVRQAGVLRRLPGTVRLHIVERTPALAAAQGPVAEAWPRDWFLVSDDGVVLERARADQDRSQPRVVVARPLQVGRRLDPNMVAAVLAFRARMPASLAGAAGEMRLDERNQVQIAMRLLGREVPVRMGGPERIGYKFQVLEALLGRLAQEGKPVAYIDLRYTDPAVGHLGMATNPLAEPVHR